MQEAPFLKFACDQMYFSVEKRPSLPAYKLIQQAKYKKTFHNVFIKEEFITLGKASKPLKRNLYK